MYTFNHIFHRFPMWVERSCKSNTERVRNMHFLSPYAPHNLTLHTLDAVDTTISPCWLMCRRIYRNFPRRHIGLWLVPVGGVTSACINYRPIVRHLFAQTQTHTRAWFESQTDIKTLEEIWNFFDGKNRVGSSQKAAVLSRAKSFIVSRRGASKPPLTGRWMGVRLTLKIPVFALNIPPPELGYIRRYNNNGRPSVCPQSHLGQGSLIIGTALINTLTGREMGKEYLCITSERALSPACFPLPRFNLSQG